MFNYYVDDRGVLLKSDGGVVENFEYNFLHLYKQYRYPLIQIVENFPIILKCLNDYLERCYHINVEEVNLVEKNKGGNYASSAFSITTEVGYDFNIEHQQLKLSTGDPVESEKHCFTFKGLSNNFLMKLLIKDEGIDRYNKIIKAIHKFSESEIREHLDIIKKDCALYGVIQLDRNIAEYLLIEYNVFKFNDLGFAGNEGILNSIHVANYISFITRYMELTSNKMTRIELDTLYHNYEMFLINVLDISFSSSVVNIGE